MSSLHARLSPRQKFWCGFGCCPLVSWLLCFVLVLLRLLLDRYLLQLPSLSTELYSNINSVVLLTTLLLSCSIPVFAGFCSAFFWREFPISQDSDGNAGFWSVVVTWLPTVFFQDIRILAPFFCFTLLYGFGLKKAHHFWNSNRPRQWMGDFSDVS